MKTLDKQTSSHQVKSRPPGRSMKVLIACEWTQVVQREFLKLGHDAWSCDFRPSERPSNRHIIGDVRDILGDGWDLLMVAHPPCTRLCNSGVRWLHNPPGKLSADHYTDEERAAYTLMDKAQRLDFMWMKLREGSELFSTLWNADIPRIAIENPVMHKHAKRLIRNYDEFAQSFQPWQFATEEDSFDNQKKRTCLWLKNLPLLEPTGTLDGSTARDRVFRMRPGPERDMERSRFFPGAAAAMADQWGGALAR